MQIDLQHYGPVTVLGIKGKMTLGEGDELLKDCINQLVVTGRLLIVLNLEAMPYYDSAGSGEIVRTYTIVSRQGGRLVLCKPTKRILDHLAITKLLTVFEIYDSVEEAVRSFGTATLEVSCPVCGPGTWNGLLEKTSLQTCVVCDVGFMPRLTRAMMAPFQSAGELESPVVTAHVNHLWWITYYENSFGREAVHLSLGTPSTISVTGRLDLFAHDVVDMAWRSVPPPRRVVFDVTSVKTASMAGRAKLQELCAREEGGRAVILTRHSASGSPEAAVPPVGASAFVDRDRAVEQLGDLEHAATAIEVLIRRRA